MLSVCLSEDGQNGWKCVCLLYTSVLLLCSKNNTLQGVISGKPVMVINPDGIDMNALNKLNMHVNDLLQAMRAAEFFSLEEVTYGIMETNGQLTIVANKEMQDKQQTLPVPIITEGKWCEEEMKNNGFSRENIIPLLAKEGVKAVSSTHLHSPRHG